MVSILDNINVTPEFVLAGEATFTVSNQAGIHYTYHVYKAIPNPQYPNNAWFAQLVLAAEDKKVYLGRLVPPTSKQPSPNILLTGRSKYRADSRVLKVLDWALTVVWQVHKGIYVLPAGYSIKHIGKCGRCGRELTNPASIDSGIGPECARQIGVEHKENNDRQSALPLI